MKCPSCQFNNMPGNTRCIRCGASLQLATAAISIEPPRANSTVKQLRRWLPIVRVQRALGHVGEAARTAANRAAGLVILPMLPLACWTRLIIPGWAQTWEGRSEMGRAFLWAWLGLGLACVATWGSQLAGICLGLLAATHIGSIIDVWRRRAADQAQFYAVVAVAFIAVAGLYIPSSRMLLNLAPTRQYYETIPPLASGDVILFNPRAYTNALPQAGDVVLFRGPDTRIRGHVRGHAAVFQYSGDGLDRIIAGPGSRVLWEEGKLWVDGQPSDLRPLNPEEMPSKLEFLVPDGSYALFPTTVAHVAPQAGSNLNPGNCVLTADRILGRALLRNYPFWRLWVIR